MAWAVTAVVAAVGGSYLANQQKAKAAKASANAQIDASKRAMGEIERGYKGVSDLTAPYREAGVQALGQQSDFLGLNGANAQQRFIESIQGSPEFAAMMTQGENAMLQNAAATGGLRGGNLERAMAQFRPNLLTQLMNQRFSNLSNIVNPALSMSTLQANAAMNKSLTNSNLIGQQGAAYAGALTAQGAANVAPFQMISDIGGTYTGASIGQQAKAGKLGTW